MSVDLKAFLQTHFGFPDFRPGQEEVILHLLMGESVLAVMATGAGKSLCFQLPARLLEGLTVVVSPLVALMQDQVASQLRRHPFQPPAAFLNHALSFQERERVFEDLRAGRFRMLYVAPEQFRNRRLFNLLRYRTVALLAVDEAHCISEWGHDFRPDYLTLKDIIRDLRIPRVLALTATATPALRKEIQRLLGMPMREVIAGFDRPNLRLEVYPFESSVFRDSFRRLILALEPPGLIYTNTRHESERIARQLLEQGYRASCYHAGMSPEDRRQVQARFLSRALDIVAATSAFGLGIDKPDIRFVLHIGPPESVERYYQEVGRAGRDGLPSRTILLYPADRPVQRLPAPDLPNLCELLQVYHALLEKARDHIALFTPEALPEHLQTDPHHLPIVLSRLELLGLIRRLPDIAIRADICLASPAPPPAVSELLEQLGMKNGSNISIELDQAAFRLGRRADALEDTLWEMAIRGYLSFTPTQRVRAAEILRQNFSEQESTAYRASWKEALSYHRSRQEAMRSYILERGCRHRFLRRYFGEKDAPHSCNACDNCAPGEGLPSPEVESLLKRLSAGPVHLTDIGKAVSFRDARLPPALHAISFDLNQPLPVRLAAGIAKMWLKMRS